MPNTRRRPMPLATRARLGGLAIVAGRGPDHLAAIGREGGHGLDRRIAREAGINESLPPEEYARRLKAARTAYYVRLAERRWGKSKAAG